MALVLGRGNYVTILFVAIGLYRLFISNRYDGKWINKWYEVSSVEKPIPSSDESADDTGIN